MSASDDARRARVWSFVWWIQAPIVCGGYFLLPQETADRFIGPYIAFASIAAMGVTYAAKAKAADAEAEASDKQENE